jgi:hypothetical protein
VLRQGQGDRIKVTDAEFTFIAVAIEQPADLDVGEIIVRPTAQA